MLRILKTFIKSHRILVTFCHLLLKHISIHKQLKILELAYNYIGSAITLDATNKNTNKQRIQ